MELSISKHLCTHHSQCHIHKPECIHTWALSLTFLSNRTQAFSTIKSFLESNIKTLRKRTENEYYFANLMCLLFQVLK